MGREENQVEKYLDREIKKLGGVTRKWVSPGHDGVPDRICIIPRKNADTLIIFVEVKTLNGKLSRRQNNEIDTLKKLGVRVVVTYGSDGVDEFLDLVRRILNANTTAT